RRAGDDGAGAEALEDRLREERAADRRGQAELVAAGQEDAGRIAHLASERRIVRLDARHRVHGSDRADAEPSEDLAVALAGKGPERRRGRQDDHDAVLAAREGGEAAEDHPVANLVLRTADDHYRAVSHLAARGFGWHGA